MSSREDWQALDFVEKLGRTIAVIRHSSMMQKALKPYSDRHRWVTWGAKRKKSRWKVGRY